MKNFFLRYSPCAGKKVKIKDIIERIMLIMYYHNMIG